MATLFDAQFVNDNFTVYTFRTGRWRQNTYLILNNKSSEIFFIDPGGDFSRLQQTVIEKSAQPMAAFLTHAHHDHVGALNEVCHEFKIPFYMHEADLKLLKRAPLFAYSFEGRVMKAPEAKPEFYNFKSFVEPIHGFSFIETPGHTAGGVVVQFENFAFTGDTLLNRMIGRTDLPGSCIEKLHGSIELLFEKTADEVVLFPGHGQPWKAKEAKAWWSEHKNNVPEYRTEDENVPY